MSTTPLLPAESLEQGATPSRSQLPYEWISRERTRTCSPSRAPGWAYTSTVAGQGSRTPGTGCSARWPRRAGQRHVLIEDQGLEVVGDQDALGARALDVVHDPALEALVNEAVVVRVWRWVRDGCAPDGQTALAIEVVEEVDGLTVERVRHVLIDERDDRRRVVRVADRRCVCLHASGPAPGTCCR